MASLIILKGPNAGQQFSLGVPVACIGRQPDVDIYLESLAVSRHHAEISQESGQYFIQDVGSSNGTFLNGEKVSTRCQLSERDHLQIGPYVLALRVFPQANGTEENSLIRASINATRFFPTPGVGDSTRKLQIVLDIGRHLCRTFDRQSLLNTLLDQLFLLFPQAQRGLILLCQGEELVVRAYRDRIPGTETSDTRFSRKIVRRALEEGIGLLSDDIDPNSELLTSSTFTALNLRSFLCVPLISSENQRMGVIQLDCTQPGQVFHRDDLEVLTAIALQAALALDNANLHAEQVRQARLHQDLLLAREVQQAFLPMNFQSLADARIDLYAQMQPAREVSGDLYDFFRLPDGRLAFFLGDVSGKGMPAALFMFAVRTLIRHLSPSASGPADLLTQLNRALVADNPTALFVTLIHGVYNPVTGAVELASGGHPPPLIRRTRGKVDRIDLPAGMFLGCSSLTPIYQETSLTLQPQETLILYTDGFTEALAPNGRTQFGELRLRQLLGGMRTQLCLEECAARVSEGLKEYTGQTELQDDQTLFLLRRPEK